MREAIAAYREAIRLKPDLAQAHNNLGIALREPGRRARGDRRRTARRSASSPTTPQAHYNLGIALDASGDVREAIAAYREAIRLKPDYAEAHYNLGNALREPGERARGDRGNTARRSA